MHDALHAYIFCAGTGKHKQCKQMLGQNEYEQNFGADNPSGLLSFCKTWSGPQPPLTAKEARAIRTYQRVRSEELGERMRTSGRKGVRDFCSVCSALAKCNILLPSC